MMIIMMMSNAMPRMTPAMMPLRLEALREEDFYRRYAKARSQGQPDKPGLSWV
jgi:hypothetical protein